MTNQQHPITPPPELVAKLWREASAGRDDAPIGEIFNHGVYLAYRAMCAELVEALHEHTCLYEGHESELVTRARALLDQPVAEGPTDEELRELRRQHDWPVVESLLFSIARAVLARFGRPTPQPVAVSERLPGLEDCDEQGRCWMFGNVEGDWRLISVTNSGIPKLKYCFSHWLPANALPTPGATNE